MVSGARRPAMWTLVFLLFMACFEAGGCRAQTAEDIMAKARTKMQVVRPVGHDKPCPKAASADEIIVCGRHERADTYKLERDESPFGGQYKGMTLAEIGAATAEDKWGHHIGEAKPDPATKAREAFEKAEVRQQLPSGFDIFGAAGRGLFILKKAIDAHNDDRE